MWGRNGTAEKDILEYKNLVFFFFPKNLAPQHEFFLQVS